MKIRKAIPHVFTSANLACGVIATILALKGFISYAPYFIFLAAIFDFFDGFVARLLKVSGEFGKQLDSLADVITFGVAPGIIAFQFLQLSRFDFKVSEDTTNMDSILLNIPSDAIYWGSFLAILIPVLSALRLAKFNIDTRQSDQFYGLPTPANALFFASFPLLFNDAITSQIAWKMGVAGGLINETVLMNLIVLFSLLLVLEIPLFSLKFKTFDFKNNSLRYSFMGTSLILLIVINFWAIPVIVILYVILSIIKYLT